VLRIKGGTPCWKMSVPWASFLRRLFIIKLGASSPLIIVHRTNLSGLPSCMCVRMFRCRKEEAKCRKKWSWRLEKPTRVTACSRHGRTYLSSWDRYQQVRNYGVSREHLSEGGPKWSTAQSEGAMPRPVKLVQMGVVLNPESSKLSPHASPTV
jgi:hypothetical protein